MEQIKEPTAKQKSPFIKSRGMKFPKDKKFIRGSVRSSLRQGLYEDKETTAVLSVVRDGDTVIELGAGIGYMSTLVATKRKINAVHAFEANPGLIPYIKSVHAANGLTNAHVHHAILGKRKGQVDFHVRPNLLSSSMAPLPRDRDTPPETVSVAVQNARQTFKDLGANMLICDIEGAEADLIPSLDLSTLRAAVIELHPQFIGPEGVNAVFKAFMDAGFAYYHRGSINKVVSFRRKW